MVLLPTTIHPETTYPFIDLDQLTQNAHTSLPPIRSASGKFTNAKKILHGNTIDDFSPVQKNLHRHELATTRRDYDRQREMENKRHDEEIDLLKAENKKLREELHELRAIKAAYDQKNAVERVVDVLSQEVQTEIKNIPSWNKLGTRKVMTSGRTRENQIKVISRSFCIFLKKTY